MADEDRQRDTLVMRDGRRYVYTKEISQTFSLLYQIEIRQFLRSLAQRWFPDLFLILVTLING